MDLDHHQREMKTILKPRKIETPPKLLLHRCQLFTRGTPVLRLHQKHECHLWLGRKWLGQETLSNECFWVCLRLIKWHEVSCLTLLCFQGFCTCNVRRRFLSQSVIKAIKWCGYKSTRKGCNSALQIKLWKKLVSVDICVCVCVICMHTHKLVCVCAYISDIYVYTHRHRAENVYTF